MKKILFPLIAILVIVIGVALWFFSTDRNNPYSETDWGRFQGKCSSTEVPNDDFGKENILHCDASVPASDIPTFNSIPFAFSNIFDNKKSLPLMASAMIDLDNDGIDEVFVSGGVTQEDAIFKYTKDGFKNISKTFTLPLKPKATTTYGASSFDLDKDGRTDLLLTGDYGLLWYRNTGNSFEVKPINVPLNSNSSAATTTIGDYNNDGYPDIFMSNYIKLDKMTGQTIFKDLTYGATSLLLKNNGDNTFTDVTKSIGLDYIHNTFQGVFVDIDDDGFLDLVVAYDTGEARTYKNIGGKHFKMMPNPLTGKYGYPMGIAVGDYNNDGLIDFFFSNTGTSVPAFMARGDLDKTDEYVSKWLLFRNDGDFKLSDVATQTNVADFEFSWGALFEDFNLDGRQDLVVAENYVDFPPHKLFKLPCRFLVQRPDGTFSTIEDQAGVKNENYAITPLTSDFNGDGYPDFIYTNLNGDVKAFINNGGESNYLSVRMPENVDYIGSKVTVNLTNDKLLSDVYIIGEGLASDQTSTLTFGLGDLDKVKNMVIRFPNGEQKTIKNPVINKVHLINK